MIRHAFITVTDYNFFPGTLATVASVRQFAPQADVIVIQNEKNALNAAQRACFAGHGQVRLMGSSSFDRDDRFINAWELKAYGACDLGSSYDVIVGIDSDCLLCTGVDAEIERCFRGGNFIGGQDGDGVDYDESFRVYGFSTPAHNRRYMSTSLYFCGVNAENQRILNRWAQCCNAAKFNGTGPHPGHGDQGVLNAVIYAENGSRNVELLENHLWSQHWVYWDSVFEFDDGRFLNRSAAGRAQRSFHCGGAEKFWSREHRDRVRGMHPKNSYPYAWFLAMFWFGGCWNWQVDPYQCLPPASWHMIEDMMGFLPLIVEVHPPARDLWGQLPDLMARPR